MKTPFPYEDKSSNLFKTLKRPIAEVYFWSEKRQRWLIYRMVVDTGKDLGIRLKIDCFPIKTVGVGGARSARDSSTFRPLSGLRLIWCNL